MKTPTGYLMLGGLIEIAGLFLLGRRLQYKGRRWTFQDIRTLAA